MQQTYFQLENKSAGQSHLHSEIYSEHLMDSSTAEEITLYMDQAFQNATQCKVLIVGGRCGGTAEILAKYCTEIDIIEQDIYLNILQQRFKYNKNIRYRFNKQGDIGQQLEFKSPKTKDCKVQCYSLSQFDEFVSKKHYSCVILQHILIQGKINIVRELMKVSHETLITMLVPGKIQLAGLFELLAGIQKNILKVFYENQFHQRMRCVNHITGRRQQIQFWQIFVWKKKKAGQQGSAKQLEQLVQVLEQEVAKISLQTQQKVVKGVDIYETPKSLQMYKFFHFNDEQVLGAHNYPHQCAVKCIQIAKQKGVKGRALDLGCAVGRTAFDLVQYFDQVVGIDISNAFINCANNYADTVYQTVREKVKFFVGDACNLDKSIGKFNLIFGGNLIDRLYDPQLFINHVNTFLQPHGILILSSPYTWLQQYTPKQKWIGGKYDENGKPIHTEQGLAKMLIPKGFKEIKQNQNLRFVIRENDWVYQYTMANITYWQKIE